MNHGKKISKLSRSAKHRKALLKNLSNALISHKRINTTLPKARELRKVIEPVINKCKVDNMQNRRLIFRALQDKDSIKELYDVVAPKIGDRPGGYCRIIKTGFRRSDGAEMAMIELVDFNEVMLKNKAGKTKKKKVRRSGGKKSTAAPVVESKEEE